MILIILASLVFFIARGKFSSTPNPPADPAFGGVTIQPEVTLAPVNSTMEIRVKALEDAVLLLGKQIATLKSNNGSNQNNDTSLTDTKIKNLETALSSLQADVTALKGTSQTTPAPSKKSPVYIPLGAGGTADDRNYLSMNGYQVAINTTDYPGYTNMQLEVTMNLNEAVGTANARLYNKTDSSAVSSSNVSTTATSATLLSSGGFTIPTGSKTYVLQVQTTQGYTLNLQSARIKVNF